MSSSANRPRLTFGVELEFILFAKPESECTDVEAERAARPGIILIPDSADKTRSRSKHYLNTVIEHLRDTGFDVNSVDSANNPIPPAGAGDTPETPNAANRQFHRWSVLREGVTLTTEEQRANPELDGLIGVGMEVTTPAFRDEAGSYAELARAVASLRHGFRARVSQTTGLHVHVGRGRAGFTDAEVRSIAGLLWVLDPVLGPLHGRARARNTMCARNRLCSNLAYGMSGAAANAAAGLAGEARAAADVCGMAALAPRHARYGIVGGAREILACDDARAVARLMHTFHSGDGKGYEAYSFEAYAQEAYAQRERKGTIEFRQAAGSLDPRWVPIWARVCVRLCEYAAREMSASDLSRIAHDCQDIEKGRRNRMEWTGQFLCSLGLNEAAAYIQGMSQEAGTFDD